MPDAPSDARTPLALLADATREALSRVTPLDVEPLIAACSDPAMGDYQSNAAMALAGRLSKERGTKVNPRQLATDVAAAIDLPGVLAGPPEVAGPGFLNFRLDAGYVARRCTAALVDPRLGVAAAVTPERVVVEYSSPNIAKELHVGHFRATILGDAVARVLAFLGHDVIRQNHLGDWGTQFGMLLAHLDDAGGDEASLADLEAFYRVSKQRFDAEPEFQTRARLAVVTLQAGEPDTLARWRRLIDETRRHYEPLYRRLGVLLTREDERGESFYNPLLPGLVADLLAAGVVVESDGAVVSFAGGYDTPLIVRKSDGGYGYGTTDLAACRFRAGDLGADRVVYLVDQRQTQHFRQVFATYDVAVDKAGWPGGCVFEHAAFGMLLGPDNKPFKTRAGKTVRLADLLDDAEAAAGRVVDAASPDLPDAERADVARQVGIGAVKYADLSKDRQTDYVFHLDDMLRLDGHSGPYMQYAHARVLGILRKSGQTSFVAGITPDDPAELALCKHLLSFGDAVLQVGRDLRPHVLCAYLYEAARLFSRFYDACPVLRSDDTTRGSRLALCALTGRTLATGLDLLGIEHPERM